MHLRTYLHGLLGCIKPTISLKRLKTIALFFIVKCFNRMFSPIVSLPCLLKATLAIVSTCIDYRPVRRHDVRCVCGRLQTRSSWIPHGRAVKATSVCPAGSVMRTGSDRTAESQTSTTSAWQCSPSSNVSPWKDGRSSCTMCVSL